MSSGQSTISAPAFPYIRNNFSAATKYSATRDAVEADILNYRHSTTNQNSVKNHYNNNGSISDYESSMNNNTKITSSGRFKNRYCSAINNNYCSNNNNSDTESILYYHHDKHKNMLDNYNTKFSILLTNNLSKTLPPCLARNGSRSQLSNSGKVKIVLRVCSSSASSSNNNNKQCNNVVSNNSDGLVTTDCGANSHLKVDSRNRQITIFDPSHLNDRTVPSQRGNVSTAPKIFGFDGVLSEDETLTEICSNVLPNILQAVVNGSDGCVFTFGHSGIAKNHTMIGEDKDLSSVGLIPYSILWLFNLLQDHKEKTGARFSVRVSAIEVSGKDEKLKDLLADVAPSTKDMDSTTGHHITGTPPGLLLRDDPICGTQLENQSELRAPTVEKAAFYLDAALHARTLKSKRHLISSSILKEALPQKRNFTIQKEGVTYHHFYRVM